MAYNQFSSPFSMAGKGCSKSDGGSGCVKQVGGKWLIMNNKKGGVWRRCTSEQNCNDQLAGYHANS